MKRKLLLALMTVFVLAAALMGSTLAAVDQTSATLVNNVTTPYVNVTVQSLQDGKLTTDNQMPEKMAAGQTAVLNYVAVNNNSDGSKTAADGKALDNSGVTEYVVVTVTKYWMKTAESTSGSSTASMAVDTETSNSKIGWKLGTDGWIILSQTDNQAVLLYTKPVKAGEHTSVVLESVSMPKDVTGLTGKTIGVDVTAESVQYIEGSAAANADAITTAYGVPVTVDANGSVSKS